MTEKKSFHRNNAAYGKILRIIKGFHRRKLKKPAVHGRKFYRPSKNYSSRDPVPLKQ
jgi:hypothetical protein